MTLNNENSRLLDLQIELVVFGYEPANNSVHVPKFYSTNLLLAKEVSALVVKRGYVCKTVDLTSQAGCACYQVVFFKIGDPNQSFMAEASTEALAICNAAIGVMALEQEEVTA